LVSSTHATVDRKHGRLISVLIAAVVSALWLTLSPPPAYAEPTADELWQQIEQRGRELAMLVEDYNEARENLRATRARIEELDQQLVPLQEQLEQLQAELGRFSAAAYRGAHTSAFEAMIASGSPTVLLEQVAILNRLANSRRDQIAQIQEVEAALVNERAELDELVMSQSQQEQELAQQRASLEAEIAELEEMYEQAREREAAEAATQAADNSSGESSSGDSQSSGNSSSSGNRPAPPADANAIVRFAYEQLGEPYVFGAAGPDAWDCSGLTMRAYQQIGVNLPHSVRQQYALGPYVSRSELQPGDIVYFFDLGHAGIYVGDGMVIHAPKPGDVVKLTPMEYMDYVGATRPR